MYASAPQRNLSTSLRGSLWSGAAPGQPSPFPQAPHLPVTYSRNGVPRHATEPAPRIDLDSLPALIPVPDAAAILGLARSSAYKLAGSGELPSKRLGHRLYIITAGLRAFLEVS